jgi:hypothetical protein
MASESAPRKAESPPPRRPQRSQPRPSRGPDGGTLMRPAANTFWQRLLRRFRPPRKLKFTREGKYFLGITLGVGFAAINTGNNLLYLLPACSCRSSFYPES